MKRTTLLLSLMLMILLTACGTKPVEQASPVQTPATAVTPQPADTAVGGSPQAQPQTQPSLTKEKIAVFYTDANLMELIKEEREISYSDDVDKYKQAISSLEKPAKADHVKLWENFGYHSITFADGALTIDTKGSNVYNLGASGEALALQAFKQTMYQFPEVKKIVMLQDGQPIESLMGHMVLEEALAK